MSNVFIDTSIWIDYFKNPKSKYTSSLGLLFEEEGVIISDVIIVEIIPYVSDINRKNELVKYFNAIPNIPFTEKDWKKLPELGFKLVKKGINGVSVPDLIITHICLKNNLKLFTLDRHFMLIKKYTDLHLFTPD